MGESDGAPMDPNIDNVHPRDQEVIVSEIK